MEVTKMIFKAEDYPNLNRNSAIGDLTFNMDANNVNFRKTFIDMYTDMYFYLSTNYISRIGIKDVIFNAPATIVLWKDGTKTVVKVQPGDKYNPETGLAMCIVKKMAGNKGNYNKIFEKWLPKERKE